MITLTNGYPQGPNGLIVPNGSITFQLNVDATVIAAPGGFVASNIPVNFQFNAAGQIQPNPPAAAAKIWSNEELNPQDSQGLGTYYLVTFYDQNGAKLNQSPLWWQFPEAANATVDISKMVPISTVGGNVIFYPTSFAFVLPFPTPTALGGIYSNAGSPGTFITSINTDGTVSFASATTTPAGLTTQVQFNNAGSFGADSGFTYTSGTGVTASGSINAISGFLYNSAAPSGHYLRGNGTAYVDDTIQAGDIPGLPASIITSGQLALAQGGTAVDLSATGGATFFLAQNGSHVISARAIAVTDLPTATRTVSIQFVIDGGGATPSTGAWGQIYIPFACTITGWVLTADQSGDAVVDVLTSTYTGFPTTSSIASTDKPTLSSAQKADNLSVSVWTTTVAAGTVMQINLNSASTVTRLNLTIVVTV